MVFCFGKPLHDPKGPLAEEDDGYLYFRVRASVNLLSQACEPGTSGNILRVGDILNNDL